MNDTVRGEDGFGSTGIADVSPLPSPSVPLQSSTSLSEPTVEYVLNMVGFFDIRDPSSKFIIKEIALASLETYETINFIIESPYDFDVLSINKKLEMTSSTHFDHGIKWQDGNVTMEDAIKIIKILISPSTNLFARKTYESEIFEKLLGKPVKILSYFDSSNIKFKLDTFDFCKLPAHKKIRVNDLHYDCALAIMFKNIDYNIGTRIILNQK